MDPGSTPEEQRARKPFAAWLQEQRAGLLHSELSDALVDVVQAVTETGKPGAVTLTIKVKRSKIHGAVEVEDDVRTKTPSPERAAGLFFHDDHGNLSRRDPRQPELPLKDAAAAHITTTRPGRTGTEG